MSVVRVANRKQYTIIAQDSIRDERLSLKARGLHAYLLSFPDDWEFSIKHITDSLKDGRASVRSALAELVELGYAERITPRNDDGTLAGTTYLVYESPRDRETENRTLGYSVKSSTKSNKNNESTERPKDRQSVLPQLPITEEEPIKEPIIDGQNQKKPDPPKPKKNQVSKKPGRRPESVDEVIEYFASKNQPEPEARKFFENKESVDWVQGRTPLKNWKRGADYWIRNIPEFSRNGFRKPTPTNEATLHFPEPQMTDEERKWLMME